MRLLCNLKNSNRANALRGAAVSVVLLAVAVVPVEAGESVPFAGTWSGVTVSAEPTDDPDVVLVTTAGDGRATHLGGFSMVSPHLSFLQTLEVEGLHIFTAANGDELIGEFSGQLQPTPDGFLAGELPSTIIGGTGRFREAAGEYAFELRFDPATFQSIARIRGRISRP